MKYSRMQKVVLTIAVGFLGVLVFNAVIFWGITLYWDGGDLTPVYVPHVIKGLSSVLVVYCRGEGVAEAEAIHVAANAAGVI